MTALGNSAGVGLLGRLMIAVPVNSLLGGVMVIVVH